MPGLVGVAGRHGPEETERRFAIARDRMLRHGRMTARSVSSIGGRCLVGRVVLGESAGGTVRPIEALFHGCLHNEQALRAKAHGAGPSASVDELIAALYAERGAECVELLDGEFCLVVVDQGRRQILLATDTVGNYPLYWSADSDGLIFASDLSAVLRARPGIAHLDLRAVADYLTFGAVLGERTLAAEVSLLDSGTVLTYDIENVRVSFRSYARAETMFGPKVADKTAYLEAVGAAFRTSVQKAAVAAAPVGLSLSGGLDSRAILSAVPSSVGLRTYTLGVDGCADQVIAERLAGIAGTQHVFFRLDDSYLRDFLPNMEQMVSLTDGLYLSHGLTEMLAVRFLDETGIGVLLRGHGGELAKTHLAWPLHVDRRIDGMTSVDELVPYLSRRANYVTPGLPLSKFLLPAAAAGAGPGTLESFAASLEDTDLSPADSCSYLYLRELHRRFTIPSLELFRTRVEVRLPFVDPQFLRVLLSAPSRWRASSEIHRYLTASGLPELLSVRNSNSGARAGAGPLEEAVMDKLNTILKRMNVRGYRHYHNFADWMRRMLLETVEVELLSPVARIQAFVDRNALAALIADTREGKTDRSYLLQVLLILELWQRENGVEVAK